MIELIPDLPGSPKNLVAFTAKGEVTGDDYEKVLIPAIEQRLEHSDKIRMLYVLGEEFTGYSGGAMWEDAKVGMFNLFSFERIAVVTDDDTYGRMIKAFGFLVPGKARVFDLDDFDDALEWIGADDEDDD